MSCSWLLLSAPNCIKTKTKKKISSLPLNVESIQVAFNTMLVHGLNQDLSLQVKRIRMNGKLQLLHT